MRNAPVTREALFERVQAAWDHARDGRPMPRRQDIDAVKLGTFLPYVGLMDVIPGESLDLRYRLVGGQTTQSFGFDLTGHIHSEVTGEQNSHFLAACRRCIETRLPQTLEIAQGRNKKDLPFQVTARIWPLSEDGTTVTGFLGGAVFRQLPPAAPNPPPS